MNKVFANCSEEDKICPHTTKEIAEAQQANSTLKHLFSKCNAAIDKGLEIKLIENTACVCKDGQLVIPKPLQVPAAKWYQHYLQHPGHTLLEETMSAEIDMAKSVTPEDIHVFLDNAAWAICSTYHSVLKASPGAAIFGQDMLVDIPFVADWHKIGEQNRTP
jgi:hypothetical protein